jgi:hypothetical protein
MELCPRPFHNELLQGAILKLSNSWTNLENVGQRLAGEMLLVSSALGKCSRFTSAVVSSISRHSCEQMRSRPRNVIPKADHR